MSSRQYDPGNAELDVLKVLWDEGPSTVREVLTHLHVRGRKLAYTTVQTLLTRLEQKRLVRANRSDMAHVFRPSVSRDKITQTRLRALVEQLFDGAAGPMVLQLVRTERLTPRELGELHALIAQLDGTANSGRAKSG